VWYKRRVLLALSGSAKAVAWICFIVGIVLLLAGVLIGLWVTFKTPATKAADEAKKKIEDAKRLVDSLRTTAVQASLTEEADANAQAAAEGTARQRRASWTRSAASSAHFPRTCGSLACSSSSARY
jgi:hypothetical protein